MKQLYFYIDLEVYIIAIKVKKAMYEECTIYDQIRINIIKSCKYE